MNVWAGCRKVAVAPHKAAINGFHMVLKMACNHDQFQLRLAQNNKAQSTEVLDGTCSCTTLHTA